MYHTSQLDIWLRRGKEKIFTTEINIILIGEGGGKVLKRKYKVLTWI